MFGVKERIAAFGAEKVLFVICPLAQLGIVERDEAFVDDCRFAVITLGSISLQMKTVTRRKRKRKKCR